MDIDEGKKKLKFIDFVSVQLISHMVCFKDFRNFILFGGNGQEKYHRKCMVGVYEG